MPVTTVDAALALSAACLGVFVGANLTEGCVLVPYWRAIPPADFFAWYVANDARLLGFFGPLTTITVLVALGAAALAAVTAHPGRRAAALAAGLTLVAMATFFVYFRTANASFSAGTAALPVELARWAAWHWVRTALGAGALAAAFTALRASGAGTRA